MMVWHGKKEIDRWSVYFVPRDFTDPLSLIIRMSSLLPFNFYKIEHFIPLSLRKKKYFTLLFDYQVSPPNKKNIYTMLQVAIIGTSIVWFWSR